MKFSLIYSIILSTLFSAWTSQQECADSGAFANIENYPNELYISDNLLDFEEASACCQLCENGQLVEPEGQGQSKAIADVIVTAGPRNPRALWIGVVRR